MDIGDKESLFQIL